MSCEKTWKPIDHFTASTSISLVRQLAEVIDDLVASVCEGYLLIVPGEWLNMRYVQACLMIEHFLSCDDLMDVESGWQRPFESLIALDDECDILWETGGREALRTFRGFLDEEVVKLGIETVHDATVEVLTTELRAGLEVYQRIKREEERKWLQGVEKAAEESRFQFGAPPSPKRSLSFSTSASRRA